MWRLLSLCFITCIFLINSCDTYLGYNYDAEEPVAIVKVSGNITNLNTGEPVDSALVQLGLFQTFTDINGDFIIYYELTTSDQRDKPVPLVISALDYYDHSDEFVLYQGSITKNVKLQYAAPMINSARIYQSSGRKVCSAIISDYQGVSNIRQVMGTFFYYKPHMEFYKSIDLVMEYKKHLSPISAEYDCTLPVFVAGDYILLDKDLFYYIYADDYDGYTCFRRIDQ